MVPYNGACAKHLLKKIKQCAVSENCGVLGPLPMLLMST